MLLAAEANSFSRRPVMKTYAPSATKRFAVARPIPLVPPVTSAIFPSSLQPIFSSVVILCLFQPLSSPPIRSSFLFLPLPRHPLLDIRRAVQHRDIFVLAGIEEPNCFDVHEIDLLQIQRDRLSAADLGLYLIEMVRSKLSAQPKSNFA